MKKREARVKSAEVRMIEGGEKDNGRSKGGILIPRVGISAINVEEKKKA